MRGVCLGVILAVLMISAGAAEAQTVANLWGHGISHSCGRWVTARQDKDNLEMSLGMAWLQGFFSGMNYQVQIRNGHGGLAS